MALPRRSNLDLKIYGMDCADEVEILKREVGPVVGGEKHLAFNILNGKMSVSPGEDGILREAVLRAVARTGMRAELWQEEGSSGLAEDSGARWGRVALTATSGLLLLGGFLVHVLTSGSLGAALGSEGAGLRHGVPLWAKALYASAILAGVWHFLPKAWLAARRLRPDMNLLMTIAVLGAVAIGEWLEAATVSFLFALALALESWSIGRARRAVVALLELAPPVVRLKEKDGTEREVSPDQVSVKSMFVVKPGERIALDGQVVMGTSEVNQAPITGESVLVPKAPGDTVFAGTINGDGALEVESTKPAQETTLAQIIRLVGKAQSKRGPLEQWVERFARIYTPVILTLAVAVLLIPPLLFQGAWTSWLYRSLVLLVIACPCALMISTPVSIVSALAASARNGVLVKGGVYMEAAAGLKAIALDKTGTLTEGKPRVVEVVPLAEHSETDLLERAAALEARSEHPLARVILAYAGERNVPVAPAQDFQILKGKGATGRFNGKRYWIGSHRYLEERNQESKEVHEKLETMAGAGRSVVVVGNETHVCGLIAVADRVRPDAREAIGALKKTGIEHVIMLTGDNRGTAQAIAKETGVDEFRAELLPSDKVAVIEALVSKYGRVAMVGDGVNDAPAMARSTLGIAMGAAGTDVAIETADVALMSDDLSKLPWLVGHSRRTVAIIRQNIAVSLFIKALFVGLTFLGYASLWAAIAADMGVSILVIVNALRLLRSRG